MWLSVFIEERSRSRGTYSGVFLEVEVDMRFEDIASSEIDESGTPLIWLKKCVSMSRQDGAEGRRGGIGSQETASDKKL